jgi:D-3-phosphoglycerate dehydrogenase
MARILLTNRYAPEVLQVVQPLVPEGFTLDVLPEPGHGALLRAAPHADYFLASGRVPIDAEVVKAATRLRMVQRTGVGTDGLDRQALQQRGIPVYVNPGVNARSVAEHTVLLMLALLRNLPGVDARLRSGKWLKNETGLQMRSLEGRTVGLLGLGHIGRHVTRMLAPFGVQLHYYKPQPLSVQEEQELGVTYCQREALLREVDILCILCPLNDDTRNSLDRAALASMKPGAFLVNTARGGIVDQPALVEALRSGHLAGAAVDVFAQEPPDAEDELLKLSNTVVTPHVAGLTRETFTAMLGGALENIRRFHVGDHEAIAANKLI